MARIEVLGQRTCVEQNDVDQQANAEDTPECGIAAGYRSGEKTGFRRGFAITRRMHLLDNRPRRHGSPRMRGEEDRRNGIVQGDIRMTGSRLSHGELMDDTELLFVRLYG